MNNRQRFYISFIILAILIFGLYFFTNWFSKVTGYFTGEDEKIKLAQCLEGKGAEFFTSQNYCEDCFKQVKELGKGINYLTTVDCEINSNNEIINSRCKNLKNIPALYVNKTFIYGYKNLTELQSLSGCLD